MSNVVVVELAVPHVHPYVHVCVTRHGFGLDGLVFKFADLEESPAADQGGTNFPGEDGTAADVGEKTDDVEEGGEEDVDADLVSCLRYRPEENGSLTYRSSCRRRRRRWSAPVRCLWMPPVCVTSSLGRSGWTVCSRTSWTAPTSCKLSLNVSYVSS